MWLQASTFNIFWDEIGGIRYILDMQIIRERKYKSLVQPMQVFEFNVGYIQHDDL